MQRDVNKNISSHPSSKELANFVEGNLNKSRRAEITKHLIACDECSDVVALVMKYGKKKIIDETLEPVNNYNYKGIGMFLGGLSMASLVIFINLPNESTKLGVMDLSKTSLFLIKGATDIEPIDKIIDADRVLASIIKITDLSHIESFIEAKDEELKGDFEMAKGLYSQAIIQATMTSNIEESLKQKIVIHARLLDLSVKNKNQEAIEEYKNILRYEIRLYSTKLK